MKLELYLSTEKSPLKLPCNEGFTEARSMFFDLQRKGMDCQLVVVDYLSDGEREIVYGKAIGSSVSRKYAIRRVFGSRKHSGWLFGKGVPALFVYEDEVSMFPTDVYPHEEGNRTMTVRDYLEDLQKKAMYS